MIALTIFLCWCASHHIVRTGKGLAIVNKRFIGFSGTCADIRGWKWENVVAHPNLSHALVQAGYGDLLPKEPTLLDKTIAKTKEVTEEVIRKGTNTWQSLKTKMAKPDNGQAKPTP
ncbi:MAG: hypothetical protein WCJ02_09085 [bacterium]